jgi:hypothetical protein
MCGTPHAVANIVYACCRISDLSCDKGAGEQPKHKGLALDYSLPRVVKHGTLILLPRYFLSFFLIGLARRTLRAGSTPLVPRSYQHLWP